MRWPYKVRDSDISYTIRFTPVEEGFLWWKWVVFKWQVVKLFKRHWEQFNGRCFSGCHVEDRLQVLAHFNEDDKESALVLLGKYNKSLENNLT